MSQPWYNQQTANHLIWAVALVSIVWLVLVGFTLYWRHQRDLLYARLAAEEAQRQQAARDKLERE
jgi:hypothetical protein